MATVVTVAAGTAVATAASTTAASTAAAYTSLESLAALMCPVRAFAYGLSALSGLLQPATKFCSTLAAAVLCAQRNFWRLTKPTSPKNQSKIETVISSLSSPRSSSSSSSSSTTSSLLFSPASTTTMSLLHLPDDALSQILRKVLEPVSVEGRERVTLLGLSNVRPVSMTCTRLRRLVGGLLTDVDLSNGGSTHSPAAGGRTYASRYGSGRLLRFGSAVGGAHMRRLYLRWRYDASWDLRLTAAHCSALRTLDLSFHAGVDDTALRAFMATSGSTLRALLVRACGNLSASGILHAVQHCPLLHSLDVSAVPAVTDDVISHIIRARAPTLRVLAASHCKRVGNASLLAVANHQHLQLQALFLRATAVTDMGVYALADNTTRARRAKAERLEAVDIVDCAHVTNAAFTALHRGCPLIRERMDAAGGIQTEALANAVAIVADYVVPITADDPAVPGRRAIFLALADAACAHAIEASVRIHQALPVHPHELRIISSVQHPNEISSLICPPAPATTTTVAESAGAATPLADLRGLA